MPDNDVPSTGSGSDAASHEQPSIDEVFPLVTDLGQLLLDWSWEGTVGLEDKIDRTAKAYGHDVTTLIGAESAVIQMGDRDSFLKALPGIPPLAALPRLKSWLLGVEGGELAAGAAREQLHDIAATGDPPGARNGTMTPRWLGFLRSASGCLSRDWRLFHIGRDQLVVRQGAVRIVSLRECHGRLPGWVARVNIPSWRHKR